MFMRSPNYMTYPCRANLLAHSASRPTHGFAPSVQGGVFEIAVSSSATTAAADASASKRVMRQVVPQPPISWADDKKPGDAHRANVSIT